MAAISRVLTLMTILPLFGCVTVEGYVLARGTEPLPRPLTFTMLALSEVPTLEVQGVNACIQTMLERTGARAVGPYDHPATVVTFSFDNGGTPIGYRANTTSPWPDVKQTTVSAVYGRRFRVLILDAEADRPRVIWEAEVRSSGSSASLGPVAFTFLEQVFLRFPGPVSNQHFQVTPNETCALR